MSTPIYLIRQLPYSKIVWVARVTENNVLEADDTKIAREEFTESQESQVAFYKDQLEYVETDKETFDKVFIERANYINEIVSE